MQRLSKIKLLLDVVEDMRSLADSLQALADAMTQGDTPEAKPVQKAASPPSQGTGGHAGAGSGGAGRKKS